MKPKLPKTFTVSLENKKARGSGHERKDEILSAAKHLFLEEGVHSVSTRRIAERVGISQTALYVYFENKDAILTSLTDAAFRKLGEALDEVERTATDPLDYLRKAIPAYMRFGLDHPDEYQIAFMLAYPGGSNQPPNSKLRSMEGVLVFEAMERQVLQALKLGFIKNRRRSAHGVAQSVWASIHGLVAARVVFPNFPWVEANELIAIHAQILLDGLVGIKSTA